MRTIKPMPAAVKSLFASSSTRPMIFNGRVAVVAIDETLKAELERPVLVEPVRADVPRLAFANTPASAVARSVRDALSLTLLSSQTSNFKTVELKVKILFNGCV